MFRSITHVSFYTEQMDEMIRFYTEKLGGTLKVITRYGVYTDRDDRPQMQEIARKEPDKIFNVYVEIAPLQFVEFFPAAEGQKSHTKWNEHIDYSHFAILVDDIFETRKELQKRGLVFDTAISKGPSETYQMWAHDPDGNRFEFMQFTANSYQVKGAM